MPHDVVLIARFAELLNNPTLGPVARRTWERGVEEAGQTGNAEGVRPLSALEQIEVYGAFEDPRKARALAVLRGVPAAASPEKWPAKRGGPAYRVVRQLPSGVVEHAPAPGERGVIFTLPSRTWIVVDDASAPRVAAMLAANPSPPPASSDNEGLLSLVVTERAFDRARAAGLLPNELALERLVVSIPRRDARAVELEAQAGTTALAEKLEAAARERLSVVLAGASPEVTRDGRVVRATLHLP